MERAGSAVELRPAPKARSAAHPQERQHSAAEGGTRDRVRPAGALHARRSRRQTRVARNDQPAKKVNATPGATRLEPGPKETRKSRLFAFSKRAQRAVSANVSGT